MAGAYRVLAVEEKPIIPDVVPMRRGRPSKPGSEHQVPKPSPSPMRVTTNDPFGALDATIPSTSTKALVDEASSRFPPLDEFSILQDSKSKFTFDLNSEPTTKHPKDISQRVTDALADDAFARPAVSKEASSTEPEAIPSLHLSEEPGTVDEPLITKGAQFSSSPNGISQRPAMVSTGTMTSPSTPSSRDKANSPRPIFCFPSAEHRSSRQPISSLRPESINNKRPGLLEHRSKSQTPSLSVSKSPVSSRPSLEGPRPPQSDMTNMTINRSKSASSRSRPVSIQVEPKKSLRYREPPTRDITENPRSRGSLDTEYVSAALSDEPGENSENSKIGSNVDFLRAMEEEEPSKRKEKRLSSGSKHVKRASMPSISLSSTKSLLAGRFGDAFRRFETNTGVPSRRTSSPSPGPHDRNLTPIAGSEATDSRSDDGHALEETEPVPAEVRRELERRRLSQEEKRVSDAGAAYRQKFAEKADYGRGPSVNEKPNSRAASIQSKVKSLLDENVKNPPTKAEATYSQTPAHPPRQTPQISRQISRSEDEILRRPSSYHITRKPPASSSIPSNSDTTSNVPNPSPRQNLATSSIGLQNPISASNPRYPSSTTISGPPTERPFTRPSAPPKPHALRTSNRDPETASSSTKPTSISTNALPPSSQPAAGTISPGSEDWEEKFSKRYPALAGLEMVETDVGSGARKSENLK